MNTTQSDEYKEQPDLIEQITIRQESNLEFTTRNKKLIFMLQGKIDVSIEAGETFTANAGDMFFIELENKTQINAITDSRILILRICDPNVFNSNRPIIQIRKPGEKNSDRNPVKVLKMNDIILFNANFICKYFEYEVNSVNFHQFKIKEMIYLLNKEYSTDELHALFEESISIDVKFSDSVKRKVHQYNKMSELAKAMNYTTSGFEKKFKKVFNVSPYKWMKEKKADRLYFDLKRTNTSFKELADEYGFKSNNYFIEFCIANLGKPPATIRKGNKPGNTEKAENTGY